MITEGTRAARNKGGRNIRIPADMNYSDWKRVYIDKSLSLKDWTKSRETVNISSEVKGITLEAWRRSRKLSEPVTSAGDAKTFAELQTYWAENYNVKVSDELKNLDFESVRLATQGVDKVLSYFPAASKFLKSFEADSTLNAGVVMGTEYTGQIKFNSQIFADKAALKTQAKKDRESGFHPKNTGVYEYGAHEAAHILIRALVEKNNGGKSDWNNASSAKNIVERAFINVLRTECVEPKSLPFFRKKISNYALIGKYDECVVEAIADYIANNKDSTAEILSNELWKLLKEELR